MAITRTGRVVLANLRTWWKELILVAILAIFPLSGVGDGLVFFVFEGLFGIVVWMIGFSHRHRPIFEVIRRMDAKLDAALEEDNRPLAEVRHLHRV